MADKGDDRGRLKASFAECDKGVWLPRQMRTSRNYSPLGRQSARAQGCCGWNVSHDNEQYSGLSMYLRLKGLAPPTSEK